MNAVTSDKRSKDMSHIKRHGTLLIMRLIGHQRLSEFCFNVSVQL